MFFLAVFFFVAWFALALSKDNADKLDIPGADRKKMVEYRAQLDAEREAALAKGRNRPKRKVEA